MKRIIGFILLASGLAFCQVTNIQCTVEREAQTLSVSGNTLTFQDGCGTQSNNFELVISGTPTTFTGTINGVMPGGTTTQLATTTSTASIVLTTTGGPFKSYTFTASWTGGSSPSVVVNRLASTAPRASSGTTMVDVASQHNSGSMCAQIKASIDKFVAANPLTNVQGTVAKFDAGGFTGVQYCSASDTNNMFNSIRALAQFASGALRLGNVNLVIDGPPAGAFSDGTYSTSVIGTPAIVLPSGFTLEGMNPKARGAPHSTSAPINTIITPCLGSNLPAGLGCTTAWPNRSFSISSMVFVISGVIGGTSSSTTTCTPTGTTPVYTPYCYGLITITGGPLVIGGHGSDPAGANIYIACNGGPPCTSGGTQIGSGEAASILNTQASPAPNAGTYEVDGVCTGSGAGAGLQTFVAVACGTSSQLLVRVPAGTSSCASSCGTLQLYTAVLGFGPGAASYTSQYALSTSSTFGESVVGIAFDLGQTNGIEAINNVQGQELGGADHILITNLSGIGYEEGTTNLQNNGDISEFVAGVGTGNTTCGPHTTVAFLHSTNEQRSIHAFTMTANAGCQMGNGAAPNADAALCAVTDDASDRTLYDLHCEGYVSCVCIGKNLQTSNVAVWALAGQPSASTNPGTSNAILISGTNRNTDFDLFQIDAGSDSAAVIDQVNGFTLTDQFLQHYFMDCIKGAQQCTQSSLGGTSQLAPNIAYETGTSYTALAALPALCAGPPACGTAVIIDSAHNNQIKIAPAASGADTVVGFVVNAPIATQVAYVVKAGRVTAFTGAGGAVCAVGSFVVITAAGASGTVDCVAAAPAVGLLLGKVTSLLSGAGANSTAIQVDVRLR
jgi:hypothetical protein